MECRWHGLPDLCMSSPSNSWGFGSSFSPVGLTSRVFGCPLYGLRLRAGYLGLWAPAAHRCLQHVPGTLNLLRLLSAVENIKLPEMPCNCGCNAQGGDQTWDRDERKLPGDTPWITWGCSCRPIFSFWSEITNTVIPKGLPRTLTGDTTCTSHKHIPPDSCTLPVTTPQEHGMPQLWRSCWMGSWLTELCHAPKLFLWFTWFRRHRPHEIELSGAPILPCSDFRKPFETEITPVEAMANHAGLPELL